MIRTPDPALRRRMLYPTELPGQQKNDITSLSGDQGENMENLERPGYRFDGWFVDEARTKRINPGGKLPGSVTLYDKWTAIPYPVRYDLKGGENSPQNPQFITIESGLKKLYPAHKSGMVFSGWKWKDGMADYLPEGLHEEILLEAVYTKRPLIHFETFEGARVADRETNDQGTLDGFRPPMRMGYDFTGWYYDPALLHPVSENHVFKDDTTLYAGWKKAVYTIEYDADGGIFADTPKEEFSMDTPTWFLSKPVKPGYIFKGWKDRRGRILRSIMKGSMGNRELTAVWEKDSPEVHKAGETPQPLKPAAEPETAEVSIQETQTAEESAGKQESSSSKEPASLSEQTSAQAETEIPVKKERVRLSRKARRMAAPDNRIERSEN